ncbi:hypothetical protein [Desulfobulbus propionicus]
MEPPSRNDGACERTYAELKDLRGGVADTSTLIYLENLGLLPLVGQWLLFVLTPQVITEFGRQPEGMLLFPATSTTTADDAVVQTAVRLGLPILSEDGRLLRQARRLRHPHYNSLMLLLALQAQGVLPASECTRLRQTLLGFARYSSAVIAHGDRVLQMIREAGDHPFSPETG